MSNKVYSQVAVWRATLVGKENVSGFEEFMKNELGSDVSTLKKSKPCQLKQVQAVVTMYCSMLNLTTLKSLLLNALNSMVKLAGWKTF